MTRGRALVAAFGLVLLIIVVLLWRARRNPDPIETGARGQAAADVANRGVPGSAGTRPLAPPERSTLADSLNSPASDVLADLRLVSSIVETFRSNFLQTGNPVGTNAEITAALTGRNRLRLALIPGDHSAINSEGELCDRWGTPFFFHAESATRMEIRSAGPDRKMWTADDVALTP
jgi:hypothetical protein